MRKSLFGVVIVILICLIFVKLAYAYEIKKELQDLRAYVQNIMLTSDGKPFSTTNIRVSGVGGNGNKGVMYISGDLWVGKNGGNNIYTNSINGNVGIGTTTPLSRLEVNGNIRNTGGMKIGGNIGIGTTTPNRKLHVYSGVGNAEIDIQSITGANRHYGIYHDGNNLRIRANGGNRLTIANNGNVGLSTDTPGARLDISGDLKIGTTADACNAGTVGKIRTNFTTKNLEYCNGTSWIKVNLPQCGDGEYLQYKSNAWTCVNANKTVTTCGGAIPTNGVSNATTTTRTQTWNLLSWGPVYNRSYSDTPGVCTFRCSSGNRNPATGQCGVAGYADLANGYYSIDASINPTGCNSSGLSNPDTYCVLKIGSMYVAPASTVIAGYHNNTYVYAGYNSTSNSCIRSPCAPAYCQNISLGGKSNWYLPTMGELGTMFSYKAGLTPTNREQCYWSSTYRDWGNGWTNRWDAKIMTDGTNYFGREDYGYSVRCIHLN